MATFLQSLRDRAQSGLQRTINNSLSDTVDDLRDENGNLLSVGVDVNVTFDAKTVAIAAAIVLAAAVVFVLIKKGLTK